MKQLLFVFASLLALVAALTHTLVRAEILMLTDEELDMFSKDREVFKKREVKPEQVQRAVEHLEEEGDKIKAVLHDEKVKRAQEQWDRLTPEQKLKITQLAQAKAEERRLALEASMKVLEREEVEAQLRAELDEQSQRVEEHLKREAIEQAKLDREAFMAAREAHRAKQAQRRTSTTAAVFWLALLLLGVISTKFCTAFKHKKAD